MDGNAVMEPRAGIGRSLSETRKGARVELKDLCKYYGDFVAAEAVSLDIRAGEFMTFLGPSGSGKSTTLMMIAGFTTPSAGDVLLNGTSIISQPVHTRNVGMVFQNYALFPHLSVERNIAFPLEMRKLPRSEIADKVKKALQLVRLDGLAERRPKQLSGGQQQRVALARALVFEPPVLLLDEPLGALDAKLREEMKFELKQLHHKVGATILFVTHDQEEALTLSDRIAVFNAGRLAQVGTPEALYNSPESRFVADFLGETNLLEAKVDAVWDRTCVLTIDGVGLMKGNLRDGFKRPLNTVSYTLRLENVLLGSEADSAENVFNGMIEDFLFVGNARKYLIRLSPNLTIRARVSTQRHSDGFTPGTNIRVGWNAADMLLVEAK